MNACSSANGACLGLRQAMHKRLKELSAKIDRGEHLTMDERIERQGIIFNHHGNIRLIEVDLGLTKKIPMRRQSVRRENQADEK